MAEKPLQLPGCRHLRCLLVLAAVALAVTAVHYGAQDTAGPQTDTRNTPEQTPKSGWTKPRFTERQREREAMATLIRDVYGLKDEDVLDAIRAVPRHEFVPDKLDARAYHDTPLPIGHGQTISQPYMVAEMTRRLKLTPEARVLEVGTGSGYQAAVLTEFTPHVCTIEIVEELAAEAAQRLDALGYDTVKVRHGDGFHGWPDAAPFDAIIVTCASGQIPPPLVEQLAPGGRMIIPVGLPFAIQDLMLVRKTAEGAVLSRSLMSVRFVPLVRSER